MNRGKIIALGTPGELKTQHMKETVLDLECDDFIRAAELLAQEAVFSEAATFGTFVHLVTARPDEAMARVREILGRAGIAISRLEVITPSLEDVFVTLTAADKNAS